MSAKDPARMSNEDILAELAELLATGFGRRITSSMCPSAEGSNAPNPLEASADPEPKCAKSKEVQK